MYPVCDSVSLSSNLEKFPNKNTSLPPTDSIQEIKDFITNCSLHVLCTALALNDLILIARTSKVSMDIDTILLEHLAPDHLVHIMPLPAPAPLKVKDIILADVCCLFHLISTD